MISRSASNDTTQSNAPAASGDSQLPTIGGDTNSTPGGQLSNAQAGEIADLGEGARFTSNGGTYEVMDTNVEGGGVRVMDVGTGVETTLSNSSGESAPAQTSYSNDSQSSAISDTGYDTSMNTSSAGDLSGFENASDSVSFATVDSSGDGLTTDVSGFALSFASTGDKASAPAKSSFVAGPQIELKPTGQTGNDNDNNNNRRG